MDWSSAFGRKREIAAVDGVSFLAADGAITGLLGPNGAGKTTLQRMLSTLVAPDAGSAVIDGLDIVRDRYRVRAGIGVLSDARGLYARLTARENVRYFGRLHGMSGTTLDARIDLLFAGLGLSELADRRTQGFSQGERMKVAIARASCTIPRRYLLDEPTNGLDIMSIRSLRDLLNGLRTAGKCILFSTHVMQEVSALCDTIVIIGHGRVIASGTAAQNYSRRRVRSRSRTRSSRCWARVRDWPRRHAMHRILTVTLKELIDTLRDRRTMMVTLLTSIAAGPLFLTLILNMASNQAERGRELKLPVAGRRPCAGADRLSGAPADRRAARARRLRGQDPQRRPRPCAGHR